MAHDGIFECCFHSLVELLVGVESAQKLGESLIEKFVDNMNASLLVVGRHNPINHAQVALIELLQCELIGVVLNFGLVHHVEQGVGYSTHGRYHHYHTTGLAIDD